MKKRRKVTKRFIVFIIIQILIIITLIKTIVRHIKITETSTGEDLTIETETREEIQPTELQQKVQGDDWRLIVANYENILPEDFEVELSNIDKDRQFDSRAIKYLKQMMDDMRNDGITNIWVQSAYRSVKSQKKLYDNSINKYIKQGKSKEEAEELTLKYINKPGASDHNLGLAVDFNYVEEEFEEMKGYKWLQKNADKYGFILRYPKGKEEVTGIKYEPWHWRFVGEEHAKKINELNMCLEEYVEYINN